jgi:hypothetical protein
MLKGWRTILFGAAVAALGSIQAADLAAVVPAQWAGIVMAGIGAAIMALRAVTTTAVGDK